MMWSSLYLVPFGPGFSQMNPFPFLSSLGETKERVKIQLGPGQGSLLAAKAACTPLNTNITDMSAATLTNNKMRFIDTTLSSMGRRKKGCFGPPPR
jgi:hypothetical protein